MAAPELFRTLETYYDTAPRASADVEEIGPFTLFVKTDAKGWPPSFYARPRLGLGTRFTAKHAMAVRVRQRELGIPEARDGLFVIVGAYDGTNPIGGGSHGPRGTTTELTGIAVLPRARRRGVGAAITQALVADARERGVDTVFLSAGDDAVARVYERVGFVRVGTACIGEAPEG